MSVAFTEDAVRDCRKTVTRRLGWRMLKPGDHPDVRREGFPDFTPTMFVGFFCHHMKCRPETEITRIEWRYL